MNRPRFFCLKVPTKPNTLLCFTKRKKSVVIRSTFSFSTIVFLCDSISRTSDPEKWEGVCVCVAVEKINKIMIFFISKAVRRSVDGPLTDIERIGFAFLVPPRPLARARATDLSIAEPPGLRFVKPRQSSATGSGRTTGLPTPTPSNEGTIESIEPLSSCCFFFSFPPVCVSLWRSNGRGR